MNTEINELLNLFKEQYSSINIIDTAKDIIIVIAKDLILDKISVAKLNSLSQTHNLDHIVSTTEGLEIHIWENRT